MDEESLRKHVIEIAHTWLGTPYISNGLVRGRQGGVDCAMLLFGVYREVGVIPADYPDPRPYPAEWHLHKNEEWYMRMVTNFAHEIDTLPKPADVVLFKIGRLFAHGGIVVEWPTIIHARAPAPVMLEDFTLNSTGKHALALVERRTFSIW